MFLNRKIQLIPVGDKEEVNRVYSYLRDGAFNQNKAMNQFMTALYMEAVQDVSAEDRKELNKLYTRISTSKKGSAYDASIKLPKGLPSTSSLSMKVKQDFATACKKGLLYGKISLPSYRMDGPLLVHGDYVKLRSQSLADCGLYHNYGSHQEFLEHLYKTDLEVFIKFANDITFKLVFGSPHRSQALRTEIQRIFEEEYTVGGSTIQISGTKIILNMCMEIPKREVSLEEDKTVGVFLGRTVPAVCVLNAAQNKTKKPFYLLVGHTEEIRRKRAQIHEQRYRLQCTITSNAGGHGYNKKMKPFEKFHKYERNFNRTYNHYLSRKIVDFAVENSAKYINLEFEETLNTKDRVLNNWAIYEFQQFVTYKAAQYGIVVRKVDYAPKPLEDVSKEDDISDAFQIAQAEDFAEKVKKTGKKKEKANEKEPVTA